MDRIYDFDKNGLAVFEYPLDSEYNNCYGLINIKGEILIPPKYYDMFSVDEGLSLFAVRYTRELPFALIDRNGNELTEYEYKSMDVFYCGLSRVTKHIDGNLKSGFIRQDGKLAWAMIYDNCCNFVETSISTPRAAVCKDGKWGFINLNMEEVIPCQYSVVRNFHNDYAIVTKEEVDVNGKRTWIVINPMGKELFRK